MKGTCCSAFNCSKRQGVDDVSFHIFPKNEEIRQKWIVALKRDNFVPGSRALICGDHFTPDSFLESLDGRERAKKRLYPNAVPSLFSFNDYQPPKKRRTLNSSKDYLHLNDLEESSSAQDLIPTAPAADDEAAKLRKSLDDKKRKYKLLLKRYRNLLSRSNKLQMEVNILRSNLQKKTATIKLLKQSKRRLSSRVTNLKAALKELLNKNFISQEIFIDLKRYYSDPQFNLVKKLTKKGVKTKVFSDDVRKFATTLHYYSPRAYDYVRKLFLLPHPSTLRAWCSRIDCLPGFSEPAFQELNRRVNSDQRDNYLYCSLVADEINLKQHIQFDKKMGAFFGYVDRGLSHEYSEDEATAALVLMAVGYRGYWKMPLAYFLVNGVSGQYQASVLKECISKLYRNGVTVCSITCDGTSHNITTLELLGASMSISDCSPTFLHPDDPERRISVFLDVPHMIKLIRNSFESLKLIKWNGKKGKVSWYVIENLVNLQNHHGLVLANKLSNRHTDFHRQKMKVSLATQLFSKSVANSLRLLYNQKVKNFYHDDVLATADFLELFNDLFDLFNSRKLFAYGFKRPLRMEDRISWETFLKEAQSTLLDFEDLTGEKVICSRKKTGFLGFYCNIESLTSLSDYLFTKCNFRFIITYKISQDFIELFFNAIRIRNGWNHNPTPTQFRTSFKQLLLHAGPDILQSTNANATGQDQTIQMSLQILSPGNEIQSSEIAERPKIPAISRDHCVNPTHCELCRPILFYISGAVVRYLNPLIKCSTCRQSLSSKECNSSISALINQKNVLNREGTGGLIRPSTDVYKVILLAERHIRQFTCFTRSKEFSSQTRTYVLNNCSDLFTNLVYHSIYCSSGIEDHRLYLIRLIVDSFVYIRFKKIAKEKNLIKIGKRQKLSRTIIFEGL